MSSAAPKALPCWICGQPAATREHRAKTPDLLSLFGIPSQQNPLYFHTDKRRNRRVGSLKSDILKFSNRICAKCNGATTQPHDYAWQHFSNKVRARVPAIAPGIYLRPSRVFPCNSRAAMLNVHLYFLKLFGCQIVEGSIPIEIEPFARAILNGKAHNDVYLAFGPTPPDGWSQRRLRHCPTCLRLKEKAIADRQPLSPDYLRALLRGKSGHPAP